MKKVILGIFLATLANYAWGFVYWGVISPQTKVWKETQNEEQFRAEAEAYFPETGMYYVPHFNRELESVEKLFQEGPLVMVTVLSKGGETTADSGIMIQGFVCMLITTSLIALLIVKTLPALKTYRCRFIFVITFGSAATMMLRIGDAIWWRLPWNWQLIGAFYDMVSMVIVGGILAKLITPLDHSKTEPDH